MARMLANLGNAVKAFLNTQVMGSLFDLRAGETEVPSSAYAHNGDTPGNSWFLLDDKSNFQLFRAANPGLTFIFSNRTSATATSRSSTLAKTTHCASARSKAALMCLASIMT